MAKIFELLQKKNVSGDFGIELEAEGRKLPVVPAVAWLMKDDGSLRGEYPDTRCEYIFPNPVSFKDAKGRLTLLAKAGEEQKTTWQFSFRTSAHVHLNVLDMEEEALKALIYAYVLIEEVLHNYCGKERKHNRFCLRIQDAEDTLAPISYLMRRGVYAFTKQYTGDHIRYAALNLDALRKFGSVEFRGMRGTLDLGVFNNWLGAIYNLRGYANKMKTVQAVYEDFFNKTPEEFLDSVLGDVANVFKFPGYEDAIRLAYSISIEIPMAVKEAVQKEKKILKKNEGGFDIEAIMNAGLGRPQEGMWRLQPEPIPRPRPAEFRFDNPAIIFADFDPERN